MLSILLVEDHKETRDILQEVLREAFDAVTITEAATLAQARNRLAGQVFNLALLDIGLPDGSGIDLVQGIAATSPQTYIVMATIFDDDRNLFAALRAGAHGYLLKEQSRDELAGLLRGILNGQPPLSPAIARRILQHFHQEAKPHDTSLTERETEVLTLIAKGMRRTELARLLGISPNTVAEYIKNIYRKLNVGTRAEATLEAVRLGLVQPES